MKTVNRYLYLVLFPILFMVGSCSGPMNQVDNTSSENLELKKGTANKVVELTEDEIAGILYMREEEKLAHDVYVQLYETFNHTIFLNISLSEKQHMDAMLRLIEYYNLEDPAKDNGLGEFLNDDLQDLYDILMKQAVDLKSALGVGVVIEETDIVDISEYLEETDVKNLNLVYEHLLNGSYNHLDAFNKVLEKLEMKADKKIK